MKTIKQFLKDKFYDPVTWQEIVYALYFISSCRIFSLAGDRAWKSIQEGMWIAAIIHGIIGILFWYCIFLGVRFAKWQARREFRDDIIGC